MFRKSVLKTILLSLLITFNISSADSKLTPYKIKQYIYSLKLKEAHKRVCKYDKELCRYSLSLMRDFKPYINKLYYSIVKHESGNFRYRRGLYDKYDYGLPQINIRYYTKSKLRKFGFRIHNIKQLIYNDKLSLKIGFTIFWYNICYAFANGVRYRTILEYVTTYHSPMRKNPQYIRKVRYIFYKTK